MSPVAAPATSALPAPPLSAARILHGVGTHDLTRFDEHLRLHGALAVTDARTFVSALEHSGLRGRGGAAFPFATKVRSILGKARPVVVVNAAEGEPASNKDRVLLHHAPHLVLDGAAATAEAIGARTIWIAVTNRAAQHSVATALATRPDARRFRVRLLPDRFVTGEARAMIAGLSGRPALPSGRRTLPSESGVDGRPTLLSNAETFAHVALIARHGAEWFRTVGVPDEPGTMLVTVSGGVSQPGVLEIPTGTTLGEVAQRAGAGAAQAVVVGGYHGGWLGYDPTIRLGRTDLAQRGASLGAGVLVFVGSDTCPSLELARVGRWLASQSAKQCGPCVFGLPALANDLGELARGGRPSGLPRHVDLLPGRGACAHPDGAARFVRSALGLIGHDLAAHEAHGTCGRADRGYLPTPGIS